MSSLRQKKPAWQAFKRATVRAPTRVLCVAHGGRWVSFGDKLKEVSAQGKQYTSAFPFFSDGASERHWNAVVMNFYSVPHLPVLKSWLC